MHLLNFTVYTACNYFVVLSTIGPITFFDSNIVCNYHVDRCDITIQFAAFTLHILQPILLCYWSIALLDSNVVCNHHMGWCDITSIPTFIHTTIDELIEARKWRCMVWSRLHGYFKDSLTLCYKIQSTKIAIICITAFLVWLSCFLISHQWDWAWCTSHQVWYFRLSLPVWKIRHA